MCVSLSIYIYVYRGGDSRKEFAELGEIRSLIPSKCNIMALTATATDVTRSTIFKVLNMVNPVMITHSPDKSNLFYCVLSTDELITQVFSPLLQILKKERTNLGRTIIFCYNYNDVTTLYIFFLSMGAEATEPIGSPDLPCFRLFDMYTKCTRNDVKKEILQLFTSPVGSLRIVIHVATIAFGLGVNCPNIRRIIHWGAPNDIETYIQEVGRAGRDYLPSIAILISGKYTRKPCNDLMKLYYSNNTKCRRNVLFTNFSESSKFLGTGCQCCDVCKSQCDCSKCDKYCQLFLI